MSGRQIFDAYLRQAMRHHAAGSYADAERICRDILRMDPRQADALHLLGVTLHRQGESEAGLRMVERSLKYRAGSPAALESKGVILRHLKRHREALASFERAVAAAPDHAPALNGRGTVLHALGRHQEALDSYTRAVASRPDFAEAYLNRGKTLNEVGRWQEAVDDFARAIAIQPSLVEAWFEQANANLALGRPHEALAGYDETIRLDPTHAEAYCKRGEVLYAGNQVSDALASFDQAIALKPEYAEAWNNRGAALNQLRQYGEARDSLTRALTLRPDYPEALLNLASLYYLTGDRSAATETIARCLAHHPMDLRARLTQIMLALPVISRSEAEGCAARDRYGALLRSLRDDLDRIAGLGQFADSIASFRPFYLAYQGEDVRGLQQLYGEVVTRISAARYGTASPLAARPRDDERVRVGIVSGYFCRHSVWRIPVQGWVSQLDRGRFAVFGYHTGDEHDDVTETASRLCDRFMEGPMAADQWRQVILADAPHVLIYPDIGMDAMAARLAAQRLARVQCNSLGHPVTSGYPTIDYYLSSAAMEPPDADACYTERLVRLPNLGVYYEPSALATIAVTRDELGLPEAVPVFWCGQSLFKFLPRHDDVFPRIMRAVGDCRFVFIEIHDVDGMTETFRERLAAAFDQHGLDASRYCVFLPRMDTARFVAAIGQCDVVLDSLGWSGFNSTLDGIVHDIPIVTMRGAFMRARHTSAILDLIGSTETIAATVDEYVAIAARLALDQDWRRAMGRRVAEGRHRLYRDREAVVALEAFLDRVARGGEA